MAEPGELGAQLRAHREAAGLSLRGIAQEVNYNPGYLSKVERGLQVPGRRLIQLYDRVLGADGRLLALLPDAPDPCPEVGPSSAAGQAAVWRVDDRDAEATAAAFLGVWEHLRTVGRELPAAFVLPSVAQHVEALTEIAEQRSRPHRGLLRQAALAAEYAGWMAQESEDPVGARRWTRRAAELAARSGETDLRAYTWVRLAELDLYAGHTDRAVDLAEAVRSRGRVHPRVRALAAQRSAQAAAVLGDSSACLRGLSVASELWHDSGEPPLGFGPATVPDPGLLVTGWCWFDLGRPARSAKTLTPALKGLRTTQARRLRALFGARSARAHVGEGRLDEGLAIARRALRAADSTRSATARGEFALLLAELPPLASHPPAREFATEADRVFPGLSGRSPAE